MPQIAPIYLIPVIILAIIIFRHRSMLKLVGRLMKVASDSLAANPTLVPFALGANCAVIPPLIALGAVVYFLQGNGVAPSLLYPQSPPAPASITYILDCPLQATSR